MVIYLFMMTMIFVFNNCSGLSIIMKIYSGTNILWGWWGDKLLKKKNPSPYFQIHRTISPSRNTEKQASHRLCLIQSMQTSPWNLKGRKKKHTRNWAVLPRQPPSCCWSEYPRATSSSSFLLSPFSLGISFPSFPERTRFALFSSIAERNHQKKYLAFCFA